MPKAKTKTVLDREVDALLGAAASPAVSERAAATLARIRQGCRASTGQDDLILHRGALYRWRQTTADGRGIGGVVEQQLGAGALVGTTDELRRRAEAGWQTHDHFVVGADGKLLQGPAWMRRLAG